MRKKAAKTSATSSHEEVPPPQQPDIGADKSSLNGQSDLDPQTCAGVESDQKDQEHGQLTDRMHSETEVFSSDADSSYSEDEMRILQTLSRS